MKTDRSTLTFAQAEGIDPLPKQLMPTELSVDLRLQILHVYNEFINKSTSSPYDFISDPWKSILLEAHVRFFRLASDEFINKSKVWIQKIKSLLLEGDYIAFYGFIQFTLRQNFSKESEKKSFLRSISYTLSENLAGYTIIDGRTLFPVGSIEERNAIETAFSVLRLHRLEGARMHLHTAAELYNKKDFAGAVRESIHAVESVARILEPNASTLAPALKRLTTKRFIHPALSKGFENIYGYTSDEKGIRHALLDQSTTSVNEVDALFMIGACASFVTYLIGRSR